MPDLINRLPWPLITLDFEASALDARSYPIEVGVAIWSAFDATIEVWSTLIKPTGGWLAGGVWNAEAESVHMIRQAELDEGMAPSVVVRKLNEIIAGRLCWCDGGGQDERWLATLAHAAVAVPNFKLHDWDVLSGMMPLEGYRRMIEWLDRSSSIHRAGADAERLLRAIGVGLGATFVAPSKGRP